MFPRLFSPLAIGSVTLRNRIVSSGHDTVMAEHGQITDRLIAYHEARARGGAGLIVVQVAGIHETARYTSHVLMATDDSCMPGYRALAEAVAPHGTVLFGQLFHPGREVMDLDDGTLTVAVAPSAVPTERFRVMPRPLRLAEIREIIDGYGQAAARLRAGRPRRRGDRRQPRLPPVAVPQPGRQPAHRRLRRQRGEPAPLPARGLRVGQAALRARFRRRPAHLPRRARPVGPARRHRVRGERFAGRRGARRLPERHHRDLRLAGRLRPHRAGHEQRQRLPRAACREAARGGPRAGARRRTDQPAAGGGAHHRRRPGRRLRDDQGDDLRPGDARPRGRPGRPTTSAPASAATRPASGTSTSGSLSPASSTRRPAASGFTASGGARTGPRRSWSSAAARPG